MLMQRLESRLPILSKDLLEQANRRRTYVIRSVFSLLLFAIVILVLWHEFSLGLNSRAQIIGAGERIFAVASAILIVGLLIFQPIVSISAILEERNRNTLEVLMTCPVTPWQVVLEKFLGRVLPMLICLVIGMPVLGVAYSMGGVTVGHLSLVVLVVVLLALELTAIAIYTSTTCKTLPGAYIQALVWIGVISFCQFLVIVLFTSVVYPLIGMAIGPSIGKWLLLGVHTLTSISVIAACLNAARKNLRPLTDPAARVETFDPAKYEAYQDPTKRNKPVPLPEDEPVKWREVMRRQRNRDLTQSAGPRFSHGLTMLASMLTTAWIVSISLPSGENATGIAFSILAGLLLTITTIGLTVMTVDVLSRERGNATLELLLTTPLSGQQILIQKLVNPRQVATLTWLVIAWFFAGESFIEAVASGLTAGTFVYLATILAASWIILRLVIWVSVLFELCHHSRFSMLEVFACIIAAEAIPYAFEALIVMLHSPELADQVRSTFFLLGPASLFVGIESMGSVHPPYEPHVLIINAVLYAVALFVIRQHCLLHADRYFGRMSDGRKTDVSPDIKPA